MLVYQKNKLSIEAYKLGPLGTNGYRVITDRGDFLIDCPYASTEYLDILRQHGSEIRFILLTHAHFDHIAGAHAVQALFPQVPVYLHPDEFVELKRVQTYARLLTKKSIDIPNHTRELSHEIRCWLQDTGFDYLESPGHTKGSVCYFNMEHKLLFTGDTLLHHLVRAADFPFLEDKAILANSLRLIFERFHGQSLVFPGHGKISTLNAEWIANQRVRDLLGETIKSLARNPL
jgi:glyoxylase-like metal-dependent hydrolase (beta-lactamase superfamily II)